mmetsp:Transcript_28908/g.94116  ORF Transcript_28908/g.94116 Transcript_28908/m.94116 type:complete len:379 (+) Transcript_28908:760-1896(+)
MEEGKYAPAGVPCSCWSPNPARRFHVMPGTEDAYDTLYKAEAGPPASDGGVAPTPAGTTPGAPPESGADAWRPGWGANWGRPCCSNCCCCCCWWYRAAASIMLGVGNDTEARAAGIGPTPSLPTAAAGTQRPPASTSELGTGKPPIAPPPPPPPPPLPLPPPPALAAASPQHWTPSSCPSSRTASWASRSRWVARCSAPASASTSRSDSTSRARSSRPTAVWWPTRPTSPCTLAPCRRRCGSSATTGGTTCATGMCWCPTTRSWRAAPTCRTSRSSRPSSTAAGWCSGSHRAATTPTLAASRPAPCPRSRSTCGRRALPSSRSSWCGTEPSRRLPSRRRWAHPRRTLAALARGTFATTSRTSRRRRLPTARASRWCAS